MRDKQKARPPFSQWPLSAEKSLGEKHMPELIAKADNERAQPTRPSRAVPETALALPAPPTFVSRSQPAAALPTG